MSKCVIIPASFPYYKVKPCYGFKIPNVIINSPIMRAKTWIKDDELYIKLETNHGKIVISASQMRAAGISCAEGKSLEFEEGTHCITNADPLTFGQVPMPKPRASTDYSWG